MRLDKFLANSGIGTRKEVKEILKNKKVSVNNVFVKKLKKGYTYDTIFV